MTDNLFIALLNLHRSVRSGSSSPWLIVSSGSREFSAISVSCLPELDDGCQDRPEPASSSKMPEKTVQVKVNANGGFHLKTLTLGGSTIALLVSGMPVLFSVVSVHTNNNIFPCLV